MMICIRRSRLLVFILLGLGMVVALLPAGAAPTPNSVLRQSAEVSASATARPGAFSHPATVHVVTSRTDAGSGSLRQALQNAQPGDTIHFDTTIFPPENPASITLLAALPELTQGNLTLDGSNAGVILDGSLTPAGTNGLHIRSSGNIIKGLQIVRFPGNGIRLYGDARHNLIGGNWQTGNAARGEGNIITGNGENGVDISGSGAMSNTVRGNLIGLDANGTQDFRVQSLVLSPGYVTDRTGFLATRYQGILKTTNGGTTWSAVNNGLTILDVRDLAASPSYQTDQTLFAGTASGGIFKSTNGGAAWIRLDASIADKRDLRDLAFSPNYPSDHLILAVLSGAGLYASTDGGTSWGKRRNGMESDWWEAQRVAFSPAFANDRTVFLLVWQRVYRSTDAGQTWSRVADGLGNLRAIALSPAYSSDRTIFVANSYCTNTPKISRSTNGGQSWAWLAGSAAPCGIYALGISPAFAQDRTLFTVSDWGGVYKSLDAGGSWQLVKVNRFNRSLALSPGYAQDQTLFVGPYPGDLAKSSNGGATWVDLVGGLTEFGNYDDGVRIREGARWNVIGGAQPGDRNVISNNGLHGVYIMDANTDYNVVSGNFLGTDITGQLPLGNDTEGVVLERGARFNRIGGAVTGEGNVISANALRGIAIWDSQVTNTTISGNIIGLDVDGTSALGNHETGIVLSGSSHNLIGGNTPAQRNVVSANGAEGIIITDASAYNVVSGNYIGTDASGTMARGNVASGLSISRGSVHNRIGGTTAAERNIMSANEQHGLGLYDAGTEYNQVSGNYVGLDATGTARMGNWMAGLNLGSGVHFNQIGGATAGARNVVSDNRWDGISLGGTDTLSNTVIGNYVGTDATGMISLGNHDNGIALRDGPQFNQVGGTAPAERNLVSGNYHSGVLIAGASTIGNTIRGNTIGLNVTGTSPLGNELGIGCWGNAQQNRVEQNLIGGNRNNGVHLDSCDRMVITGNLIGTNASGTANLGNLENGISIFNGAQDNTIGPDNVIAYNQLRGIGVWYTTTIRNRITHNAIYANTLMGIDTDDGGNTNPGAPHITVATRTTVQGVAPFPSAIIEVFSDNNNQGRVYEGATTANPAGVFAFTKSGGFTGPNLTVTATDGDGNTSEFSAPVPIVTQTPTVTPTRTPAPQATATPTKTPPPQATATPTRTPPPQATATPTPTPASASPPDGYEPDNTCATANAIATNGSAQEHDFHVARDTDWLRFNVTANTHYVISAIHLGEQADTDLALYDGCQGALIQQSLDFGRDTHLSWVAPVSGMVFVRARHADSALFGPATAYAFSVRTVSTGAAIIAGGRLNALDALQHQITFMTNHAYQVFTHANYGGDRIYYMSADPSSPSHIDSPSSPTNLAFAIRTWAPQQVANGAPLFLYLADHGEREVFFLDTGAGAITASQLDQWLTEFQAQRPQSPVVVIIEACRAGSFITVPASISRHGRLIITASGADNDARAKADGQGGGEFSDPFFDALASNNDLWTSYVLANQAVRANPDSNQTPWIDGDGDGLPYPNDLDDEGAGRQLGLGHVAGSYGGQAPYIEMPNLPRPVLGQIVHLQVKVLDENRAGAAVWVEVSKPSTPPPSPPPGYITPISHAQRFDLVYNPTSDRFELDFHFDEVGPYQFVFQARDGGDLSAQPVLVNSFVGRDTYLPWLMR